MEEKFDAAIKHAKVYSFDVDKFEKNRPSFERNVNDREKEEGLYGKKYGYIVPEKINGENFYNLLSEFYLRPIIMDKISKEAFNTKLADIKCQFKELSGRLERWD